MIILLAHVLGFRPYFMQFLLWRARRHPGLGRLCASRGCQAANWVISPDCAVVQAGPGCPALITYTSLDTVNIVWQH